MTEEDLTVISGHKYNAWCHRRPLVCADEARLRRANAFLTRSNLAPSEKASFYLHELTGCEGIEFVAFSNAILDEPIELSSGVVLVPCFLRIRDMDGQRNVGDPLVKSTMKMWRNSRFIYDGWIGIASWDEMSVRDASSAIDKALSLFCISGRTSFQWEPKYPVPMPEATCIYRLEEQHLKRLESVGQILDSLGDKDRDAIYRSLAWLSQGLCLREPAARFLFSILAIESLATYIEKNPSTTSALSALKTEPRADDEREQCIRHTLSALLDTDPLRAVERAYFDCVVSITQRLKVHLRQVFSSDPESYAILFEQKVDGKTLYDLRDYVAHGTAQALSQMERERIRQRVWDAERIARNYLVAVFKALGVESSEFASREASFLLDILNMVVSSERMYSGPTHMAMVYSR